MMYRTRLAPDATSTNTPDILDPLVASNAPVVPAARLLIFTGLLLAILMPPALAQSSPRTSPQAASSAGPTQDYLVYVVCESADKVVLLRFGPHGFREEHETHIGLLPGDINGPHG